MNLRAHPRRDDHRTDIAYIIGDGETKYYKVVVRLWLEGEDTTCTSETFANLTDTWSLDLKLELGQGTAVTAMTMIDGNN